MTSFAFALVLVAAIVHAAWNLLAKRAAGGIAFAFLINALATLIYTPLIVGVLLLERPHIDIVALIFIVGSGLIHIAYFLVLQQGYKAGDLSLVYPLARGTGPMLSTTVAIGLLGERLTPTALLGIFLIGAGVFILTGDPRKLWRSSSRTAVGYGLLTGTLIAAYTIWDKYAVSQFWVSPFLLNYGCNLFETLLLLPFALHHWDRVSQEWNTHRFEVLGTALLSPLAYILVLIAMVFTPVSHVAPIRELSILFGAVLGARLLSEGEVRRRLFASGVMVLGVVMLALN